MNIPEMPTRHLASIRPLVRYVDEHQAIIDIHLSIRPRVPINVPTPVPQLSSVDTLVEVSGTDGSIDEQRVRVKLEKNAGVVRLEVARPERWWPVGMGEQALYRVKVSLLGDDEISESREATVGFTSVRAKGLGAGPTGDERVEWLVNSQVCTIKAVVPIDLVHERRLLPVAGHSLLIIRGHYGPDVLYDAADRAGLLLIQCVPIDPDARPEIGVLAEVDRLAAHPSLAGWFVGHLGRMADGIADTIHELDPTRRVFRHVPGV